MDCFAALTTAALVVDLFKIVKLATKQIRALTLSVKDAHRLRTFWNAEELLSKLEVDLAELQQAIRPEGDLPVSASADVAVQLRSVAHERMEFWSSRSDAIEAVVDQSLTAERAAMESCAAAKAALQSWKAAAQSCTPTQQLSEHESRQTVQTGRDLTTFSPTFLAENFEISSQGNKTRRHDSDGVQLVCAECRLPFQSLEAHAKAVNHRAFSCAFKNCASSFGRRDLLLRHELTHTDETNYPCPHCDKYSGKNGFKRKDHLQQHLSNFHNKELYPEFCNHTDCQVKAIAVSQKAFKSMKEYRAHLREVHDQTPFPCDWPGCERKGRKGYSRERDLEAHKKTHQQAITPLYTPSENGQNRGLNEEGTSWLTGMGRSLDSQFIWNGPEDQSAALSAQRFNEDLSET
ncbi:hypothetical protein EG327_006984 [Venturia inaequalis]|uniref:C2H2-type domain-containing protein n=1 Tax=Venturia inaequalis TaxID=5025 RepID=A0A8H3VS13_VENIN|nr:hypothetical protein EG327_006984 [Venturia inaequalis]